MLPWPADEPEDVVALLDQQLGEVHAILPGDTRISADRLTSREVPSCRHDHGQHWRGIAHS